MKLAMAIILIFATSPLMADDAPHGSYRWETMPAAMRSNVLAQVATRRTGERVVVVRKSIIDNYRLNEIHFPEPQNIRKRLFRIQVDDWMVACGIYPRFERRRKSGWEGVFMYSKVQREGVGKRVDALYLPDEWHLLCILDRAYRPQRKLVSRAIWPQDRAFCEDFWKLSENAFLEKYGLRNVFSNSVYRVRENCVMVVDYPSPEDKNIFIYDRKNGVLDWHFERDRRAVENAKDRERGAVGNQHMLILSQEEASELVALVGHQWYLGDDSKYREIRREYPWFQPVDVAHPKTQLGKDLKATIEAKERIKKR